MWQIAVALFYSAIVLTIIGKGLKGRIFNRLDIGQQVFLIALVLLWPITFITFEIYNLLWRSRED